MEGRALPYPPPINLLNGTKKYMKAMIQRVLEASVEVEGVQIGRCGEGFLILLGVEKGDEARDALLLADKIAKLRVFRDENGKMNRSVQDIGGSVLVISQFTLCANYRHGNRPDFLDAAAPADAKALYEHFSALMKERLGADRVENGEFGADMKVSLINNGPVTIQLESGVLRK